MDTSKAKALDATNKKIILLKSINVDQPLVNTQIN